MAIARLNDRKSSPLQEDRRRNVDQSGRWAVTLIRWGQRSPRPFKPLFILTLRIVCGLDFPLTVVPGPGLRLAHGGRGTVVHPSATIGAGVTIYHGVTIGIAGKGRLQAPVLEDDVYLGAGSCVLGGITVGSGAVVGANAVVTRDVRPGATVVGIPAREIVPRDAT